MILYCGFKNLIYDLFQFLVSKNRLRLKFKMFSVSIALDCPTWSYIILIKKVSVTSIWVHFLKVSLYSGNLFNFLLFDFQNSNEVSFFSYFFIWVNSTTVLVFSV